MALQMVQDNSSLRPFARALLARALLGQRKVAAAMSLAEDAYCELEQLGKVQDGEAIICLAWVECLMAKPDLFRARAVLRRATEKIEILAGSISVSNWRETFLTRIPEHRRLVELAHALDRDRQS